MDKISTVTAFLFIAVPSVGLAVILKYLFALKFADLPVDLSLRPTRSGRRVWQMVLAGDVAGASGQLLMYQRLAADGPHHHAAGGLHPHGPIEGRVQSATCC